MSSIGCCPDCAEFYTKAGVEDHICHMKKKLKV